MREITRNSSIAVVGVGCRFPGGVADLNDFRSFLDEGRSGITEVPAYRWDVDEYYSADPDEPGRSYARHGGFLSAVDQFDAELFGISPEEASSIDPQHRLALEMSWEALEHAGTAPDRLRDTSTGVFIGIGGSDYERLNVAAGTIGQLGGYAATGVSSNFAANRISYTLGLRGPSLVVDTACSSSLVAVHLACQSLRLGECDTALAGGVSLMLSPQTTIALAKGRMLSPRGSCRTFDAEADGYVRGEGAAIIVLRPLHDAIEDGQDVLAVIRGSAYNQDGRSNGLTAPSGSAQREVIALAVDAANVAANDIDYVEAHGTGTPLGDPIEIRALASALTRERSEQPLWVGSVKTNIGHLEAAAGIAGLLKALLVVRHGYIPRNLHFTRPNPYVDWSSLAIAVPTEPVQLDGDTHLAGVSSFGFGGTNAHVVLETGAIPMVPDPPVENDRPVVVKLSGTDRSAVRDYAGRLVTILRAQAPPIQEIAYAAGVGRADLPSRIAVVAESTVDLRAALIAIRDDTTPPEHVISGTARTGATVAFVVAGQGSRLAGTLHGVYGLEPVITNTIDELSAVFGPVSHGPLRFLVEPAGSSEQQEGRETAIVQPARFALAVALGRWWKSVGVRPDLVAGHSVGAYAAAVLAGVMSPIDGAQLIHERALLMQDHAPPGAMAAVFADVDEVADDIALVQGAASIAAINGPRETVISGCPEAVTSAVQRHRARGTAAVVLPVTRGFHSPEMDPILEPLRTVVDRVTLAIPTDCVFVSDLTGAVAGPEVATPDYWVQHARRPVQFGAVARTLADQGASVIVELGSGGILPLVATAAPPDRALVCVPTIGTIGRVALLEAAARVWSAGVSVGWDQLNGPRPVRPPRLPGYPFQRRSFWTPTGAVPSMGTGRARRAPEPPPADIGVIGGPAVATPTPPPPRSAEDLVTVLRRELADVMNHTDPARIGLDIGLFDLGLTSAMVATLRQRLETLLGRDIRPTVVFEYPTLRRLSAYLSADDRGNCEQTPSTPAGPVRKSTGAEPIAVVGIGCRFPGGGDDPDSYWRMLCDGVDASGPVPPNRWCDPDTPSGSFLSTAVADFDTDAFGITPREARSIDPQHRLVLEVAWEALEDAGHPITAVEDSRTGVYIGINTADYLHLLESTDGLEIDAYRATGNTFSAASGRLSYVLGAKGPSMAIDTACSSSLVGVHLAIRALRAGDIDLALAGGVNLMLSPETTRSMMRLGALSADGRCKTFDAAADGYGRGEGCGIVALKRLSDAQAAGDRIYGHLLGSATNQDGRSAGFTVPNGSAQRDVVRAALHDGGLDPLDIDYVEAHGTGTPLGDPMELISLSAVLRPAGPGSGSDLAVGSVKTNIGHLEAAAGISGLIKVVLATYHGLMPAHLHLRNPSTEVPWSELAVTVPITTEPWRVRADGRRVAGVSAFGFTGTNAHVIVESSTSGSPRPPNTTIAPRRPELLLLSARSAAAAAAAEERWARWLTDESNGSDWSAVTRSAARRRSTYLHRTALIADSPAGAADLLTSSGRLPGLHRGTPAIGGSRLIFVYNGQGTQQSGMGIALLDEPVTANILHRCHALVRREAGWSLLDEMCSEDSRLDDTTFAQPAIVAAQLAQTELLRALGVRPDAVVGHSVGEIGAGYGCGAVDIETAMTIAVRRGRVMGTTHGSGAMAAVAAGPEVISQLVSEFAGQVAIAAVNGPEATVVAGAHPALAEAEEWARDRGIGWRILQRNYAFHSPQMIRVRDTLRTQLADLTADVPIVPVFSTVTGTIAGPEVFQADYWAENLVAPVRFRDALLAAGGGPHHTVVVELGGRPVLGSAALRTLADRSEDATALAMTQPSTTSRESALRIVGALHVLGRSVDLDAVFGSGPAEPLDLPRYPWQRTPQWLPDAVTTPLAGDAYEVTWPQLPIPTGPIPTGAERVPAHWLVLGDSPIATSVQAALHAAGRRATVLPAPRSVDDLLMTMNAADDVDAIVHVAAGDADRTPGGRYRLDDSLAATCAPLLAAAHLAGTTMGSVPIWTVTRGAAPVDNLVVPLQAPVWGLNRVLTLEQPDICCGIIDLDPTGPSPTDATLVVSELLSTDGEDQVAYRSGRRHVARLSSVALPARADRPHLDPAAAYLITGGRGALGLGLARHLIERGARHLVLTGRRPHSDDRADARAAVAELRAAGVVVETPAVDAAERAAMMDILSAPRPPLRGIIHAAGTFRPDPMSDMTWERFREQLRPKIDAALLLDELGAEHPLDFLVFYSSASATWGSALSGHYVAGNYFLDVLAHDRDRRGVPALAVDWGWFIGSDLVDANHTRYFEAMGLTGMSPAHSFEMLDGLLVDGRTQITVAPVDWSQFRGVLEARRRRPLLELLTADRSNQAETPDREAPDHELLGALRGSTQAVRRRLIGERLLPVINRVFGRPADAPLDPDAGFFDAGMDSLMSVELRRRVESLLGLTLEATATFEYSSIAALSEHLADRLAGPEIVGHVSDLSRPDPGSPLTRRPVADLDTLSEDDLMAILSDELEWKRE